MLVSNHGQEPHSHTRLGAHALVRVVVAGKPRLLAAGGQHGVGSDMPNVSELYTP